MAKAPLICQADLANTLIQGGHFDRCTFTVTKDSSIMNSFSFCDYSLDIDDFFSQSVTLTGGRAFLLDDAGLGNSFGEVKFLLISAKYSSSFTSDSDKYINLIYEGKTYPVGSLHIWTGQPGESAGSGVTLNPNGSGLTSPQFTEGGIVLYNPHAGSVDLKIVIASGGPMLSAGSASSGTSGTSGGTSGSSGTAGSSGSSGTAFNADYNGTSGNTITIPT
jgi:hypothetical protein